MLNSMVFKFTPIGTRTDSFVTFAFAFTFAFTFAFAFVFAFAFAFAFAPIGAPQYCSDAFDFFYCIHILHAA